MMKVKIKIRKIFDEKIVNLKKRLIAKSIRTRRSMHYFARRHPSGGVGLGKGQDRVWQTKDVEVFYYGF